MSNLSTQDALNSIRTRQAYMVAAQIATVAAIRYQTSQVTSAINLVDNTLKDVKHSLESGLDSMEQALSRMETNILESLSDIKWYLHNIDDKLAEVVNLIKFSSATKSDEYNEQGFVLFRMEDYSKAKDQFFKSIDENPLNVHAHINLAFTEIKLGDDQLAIKTFERALKILEADYSYSKEITSDQVNRTKSFVKLSLGETLLKLKMPLEAKVHFSYVINNSPDNIEVATAMYNSARCSYELGVYVDVETIIRKMISDRTISLVAIAVGGDHFEQIKGRILEIIEEEVKLIKDSFSSLIDEQSFKGEVELYDSIKNLTRKINAETDYRNVLAPMLLSDFSRLISVYQWYASTYSYFSLQKSYTEIRLIELQKTAETVVNTKLPIIEKEFHEFVKITVQNLFAEKVQKFSVEQIGESKKINDEITLILKRLAELSQNISVICTDHITLEGIGAFKVPANLTYNLSNSSVSKINQLTENYL